MSGVWYLEQLDTKAKLTEKKFYSEDAAKSYLKEMGPAFQEAWCPKYISDNPKIDRMINEGFIKRDLEGILLPRISIDEYIPADQKTDNIVLAFFIKGEPDAVAPFKNFCDRSEGVLYSDYGDSDTVVNTSIVYAEFDRENLEMRHITDLVVQAGMVAGLEVDDFTMTFPHTNQKFPYDPELMQRYFKSRDERENKIAQRKAELKAREEIERELSKNKERNMQRSRKDQQNQKQTEEALVDSIVNSIVE